MFTTSVIQLLKRRGGEETTLRVIFQTGQKYRIRLSLVFFKCENLSTEACMMGCQVHNYKMLEPISVQITLQTETCVLYVRTSPCK